MIRLIEVILVLGMLAILVWGVVEFFKNRSKTRKRADKALEIAEKYLREISSTSDDSTARLQAEVALHDIDRITDKEIS